MMTEVRELAPCVDPLKPLRENFKFLIIEVCGQVDDVRAAMVGEEPRRALDIVGREDYVDNLKTVIENKCFDLLTHESMNRSTVRLIRAMHVATSNLERIGDFAVNIAERLRKVRDLRTVRGFDSAAFFAVIGRALVGIEQALLDRDVTKALELCQAEHEVDQLYAVASRRVMDELRGGADPDDLVLALDIYHYLERMGDSLLNVGEAVIFAAVGEKLKITEFRALQQSLAQADVDKAITALDFAGIWETRSGSRLGTVHDGQDPAARWILFKDGRVKKVEEEKRALDRWNALVPGMPPRVFGFHEYGARASLLLEYLRGETLQHLLLAREASVAEGALVTVLQTVSRVWNTTLEAVPVQPRFMGQMRERLRDVSRVHPGLIEAGGSIGLLELPSLTSLAERGARLDDELVAPFSVLIHGDFNTDNIIVNLEDGKVHFIDLHRSKISDYLQDVSVFLTSNFRLPVYERALRARLDTANLECLRFVRQFARSHGDYAMEARLALGIVRSFVTSTRFALDPELSRVMFQRAKYLLTRLIGHQGRDWAEFRLDDEVVAH